MTSGSLSFNAPAQDSPLPAAQEEEFRLQAQYVNAPEEIVGWDELNPDDGDDTPWIPTEDRRTMAENAEAFTILRCSLREEGKFGSSWVLKFQIGYDGLVFRTSLPCNPFRDRSLRRVRALTDIGKKVGPCRFDLASTDYGQDAIIIRPTTMKARQAALSGEASKSSGR